ncbi:hypothetical protein CSKR_100345 [Clonorchis sinensis]|uniref:Laminin G domain-containing protein n=1 Tax=Clonorchis sinensis TaxID=79923 RepID=A0A419PDX9_CLOSI|nr:hypothetical protein CSKR_100345 [Clonorchis sinensis]
MCRMNIYHLDNLRLGFLLMMTLHVMEVKSGTLLFRSVDNYAVFPPFIPCPRATMSFEFQTTQPTGLLVYSEDNSTGRFLSITLLPMHRLKVELELRLPQYRTSRDHTTMVLDFATSHWKEPVEKGHQLWHFFNMTMSSGQTGNILSGLIIHLDEKRFVHQFTPALIYSAPLSHKTPKVYFGEPLYIGQIPDHMRSDATKRSLFSSAMQPTYNGLIQNLQLGECSVQELRGCKMSEGWRMCDTLTPAELNNGAVYIPDSRGLRVSGDECPHRTPAQSTKYIKPDVHTVSDLKTSLNQEQHRCFGELLTFCRVMKARNVLLSTILCLLLSSQLHCYKFVD